MTDAKLPPKIFTHYAFMKFTPSFYALSTEEKATFHAQWLEALTGAATAVEIYQVGPAAIDADIMIWSALQGDDPAAAGQFFTAFTKATAPFGQWVEMTNTLWGFTKPSVYSKGPSSQEINPFVSDRMPYLVVYPFVKTVDWYLLDGKTRMEMMQQHIKLGKEYPEITQLLLYSVGLQDQEFVVSYEAEDLTVFSDLVYRLRSTEVRRYTERDTPLYTCTYHPAAETLALWR